MRAICLVLPLLAGIAACTDDSHPVEDDWISYYDDENGDGYIDEVEAGEEWAWNLEGPVHARAEVNPGTSRFHCPARHAERWMRELVQPLLGSRAP